MKTFRVLISMLTGRSYFSLFDLKFNYIFSSYKKNNRLPFIKSEMKVIFFNLTQKYIEGTLSLRTNLDFVDKFNNEIRKLEIETLNLLKIFGSKENTQILIKLIYKVIIEYVNKDIYPEFSGILNDSYLLMRKKNIDKISIGPVEDVRLFIGSNVNRSSVYTKSNDCFDFLNKIRINRFLLYQSILGGTRQYDFTKTVRTLRLNKQDNSYYNLIKNKNVVLIGPSTSVYLDKILNKEADVIVLLNHRGFSKTYTNIKDVISKEVIVVSYYSGSRSRQINASEIDDIIQQTDFTVWSDKNIKKKYIGLDKNKLKGLRNHDSLIEFSRWNFTPYVLIDLLIYEPKSIFVTGINLFVAEENNNLYSSSYFDANNETKKNITMHNQFEQYNLYRELYTSKKIYPDQHLKKLLDIGVHEYLSLLGANLRDN